MRGGTETLSPSIRQFTVIEISDLFGGTIFVVLQSSELNESWRENALFVTDASVSLDQLQHLSGEAQSPLLRVSPHFGDATHRVGLLRQSRWFDTDVEWTTAFKLQQCRQMWKQ